MGMPETLVRIVRIRFGITCLVVHSVVRRPPQGPFLCRGRAQQRRQKLHRPSHRIGPVRKIAVVKTRYGEHANKIARQAQQQSGPRKMGGKNQQYRSLQQQEGQSAKTKSPTPAVNFEHDFSI